MATYPAHAVPIPADDSDLLLNVACTSIAEITAAGGTLIGSGHTFDPVLGMRIGTGGLRFSAFSRAAEMRYQGTMSFEIESRAVAVNVAHQVGQFTQGVGDHVTTGNFIYMRACPTSGAGTHNQQYYRINSTGNIANWVVTNGQSASSGTYPSLLANFGCNGNTWGRFVRLTMTWRGSVVDFWVNNVHLRRMYRSNSSGANLLQPAAELFQTLCFGSDQNGGAAVTGYWMRNIQVIKRAVDVGYDGRSIAILGDSLVEAGSPVQQYYPRIDALAPIGYPRAETSWHYALTGRLRARNLNVRIFNHGHSGHAYSESAVNNVTTTGTDVGFVEPNIIGSVSARFSSFTVGRKISVIGGPNAGVYTITAVTSTQITVAERTITTQIAGPSITVRVNLALRNWVRELLASHPRKVLCQGSVNDIANASVVPADYEASWRNTLIDIAAGPTVDKIVITSIPPFGWTPNFTNSRTNGLIEQCNAIIAALPAWWNTTYPSRAGLIEYEDLFTKMGGHNYDREYTLGSATDPYSLTGNDDLHWSPHGHARAAEIYEPVVLRMCA